MNKSSEIVVIGAGIIGCAVANRLANEGLKVTVIEKGWPGEEASRAAAGMLAPQSEGAHGLQGLLSDLCFTSHAMYPEFVQQLEEDSGMHIGYRKTGTVYVATDYTEAKILAGLHERQLKENRQSEELSDKTIHELEPALAENAQVGVFLPDDHQVENRQLMKALVSAAIRRGVKFITGTPVLGLEFNKNKIESVRTPESLIKGEIFINAAGCWAGNLETHGRIKLPIRPIRGQIVCLEKHPQPLNHLIHSSVCYMVPWQDGRILIGSTVENVGYNKDVTAHGMQQLLQAAINIVPSLATAAIHDAWAGLRPDSQDNLPLLGCTQIPNLIIASGHFRNGILLAPVTAKLITELIVHGQPGMNIEAFRPQRFA